MMEKYIENIAVAKYFDRSNYEIVRNDVIDYIRSLKLNASPYQRLHAAIAACERLGDPVDLAEMGYDNFRKAAHDLF